MTTSRSLSKRLARAEGLTARSSGGVPTVAGLWRYLLVQKTDDARTGRNGELHAHHDRLQSKADVLAASDDLLLEALGFPNVEALGWLYFMLRHLVWFNLLAYNWNLPHLAGREFVDNTPTERAYVGRQFCELMRARDSDPLAELRASAPAYMAENNLTAAEFTERLRERYKAAYIIYTCEAISIPPEALAEGNEQGKVLYQEPERSQYLAQTRPPR